MTRILISLAVVASATLLRSAPALAAESYDNCTGFITSLPATITTQGTWCMDSDLATAIASGTAITVATNNVTIDCNHFKIGGLQAGIGTDATGIRAESRLNLTVRNCNIRGFRTGIIAALGGGHMIEGSRFDANTFRGIFVSGAGSTVRDNQVVDTGGSQGFMATNSTGIQVSNGVDVVDNVVNGVAPSAADTSARGIRTDSNGDGSVIGNRVRGLAPTGTGIALGIDNLDSGRTVVRGNTVQGPGGSGGIGIRCVDNQASARDNVVAGFQTGVLNCQSFSNSVNSN